MLESFEDSKMSFSFLHDICYGVCMCVSHSTLYIYIHYIRVQIWYNWHGIFCRGAQLFANATEFWVKKWIRYFLMFGYSNCASCLSLCIYKRYIWWMWNDTASRRMSNVHLNIPNIWTIPFLTCISKLGIYILYKRVKKFRSIVRM